MRTVKTYLVRKPHNLGSVIFLSKRYPERVKTANILETIEINLEQYQDICANPVANDYDFLKGKGGRDANGQSLVIELTCQTLLPLYVNPEGFSYCRYLGVNVEESYLV